MNDFQKDKWAFRRVDGRYDSFVTMFPFAISHPTSNFSSLHSVGKLLWRGIYGRWILLEGSAFRQIRGGQIFFSVSVDSQMASAQNNFYATMGYSESLYFTNWENEGHTKNTHTISSTHTPKHTHSLTHTNTYTHTPPTIHTNWKQLLTFYCDLFFNLLSFRFWAHGWD